MRLTVEYVGGVFNFRVESLEGEDEYLEEFELHDMDEAQNTAWDLIKEIYESADEDFPEDLVKELDFDGN